MNLVFARSAAESFASDTSCDVSDIDKALQCTGLPDLYMIVDDYNTVVQEVCRANRSQEVTDCIEWLNTDYTCEGDEMFQLLVQTDRYLDIVHYFCNYSEVYVENGLCMAQAHAPALNCSAHAIEVINEMDDPDKSMTLDESLNALCRPVLVYSSCYKDAISTLCGTEATTFANRFLEFQFQVCYNYVTVNTTISAQPDTPTTTPLILGFHLSSTQEASFNQNSQEYYNATVGTNHSNAVIMMILSCLSVTMITSPYNAHV